METTRLEAIMFTDIAGYSRLMDEDEDRTVALLKRHNELVLPIIEAESGHVVDAIGDGLLVVFPSVRKAVGCAVSVHEAIDEHNKATGADLQFKLRIGIHLGEVRHEDDRIFGAGVNVAARVQQFAIPGGICITEDVFRNVERRIPQAMTSIGVQELKNITRQYELYRVETGFEDSTESGVAPGATPPQPARQSGELDEVKERILAEIAKFSEKHGANQPEKRQGTTEQKIESKVYGVVERIMDHALDKWESMPDEKRDKIVRKVKVEIDSADEKKSEEAVSKIAGEIAWGAAATIGMGLWYWQAGSVWMIVVGLLAGVIPLISGLVKLTKRTARSRMETRARPSRVEGEVIKAARELGGKVTVVQVAAHTGHALDDIEAALDNMASRGYVSQEVLETGVIRYDFPSLLPEDTDSDPIR